MRGWGPARSASASAPTRASGDDSRSGRSTASTTAVARTGSPSAVHSTSAWSTSPAPGQDVDAAPEHLVGRRRQDAAEELAAEQRGPVRPGVGRLGLEEDAGLADRRQQRRQVGATEVGEEAGRQVRQVGDERRAARARPARRRRGSPRRGSRTARRRAPGARRRAPAGRADRCAARPGRPAARRAATRRSPARSPGPCRAGRSSRPSRSTSAARDGEVGGREPGHVAGRPQPGDAQRRRPAAGQHEVQPRREVEDQRLEEVLQRVAGGDVGVVDDDDRVVDDRRRRPRRRCWRRARRSGRGCPASRERRGPAAGRRRSLGARSASPSSSWRARENGVQPAGGRVTSMARCATARAAAPSSSCPNPAPRPRGSGGGRGRGAPARPTGHRHPGRRTSPATLRQPSGGPRRGPGRVRAAARRSPGRVVSSRRSPRLLARRRSVVPARVR